MFAVDVDYTSHLKRGTGTDAKPPQAPLLLKMALLGAVKKYKLNHSLKTQGQS